VPAFIPDHPNLIGEVIRFKVQFRGITQIETWQTHFDYRSPQSVAPIENGADLAAAINTFAAHVQTAFKAAIPATVNIVAYVAESLRNPSVLPMKNVVSEAGTVSGDYLPPYNQVTLQCQTNLRGKHGRGRRQMPAVPESYNQNGYLTSAAVTVYEGICNLLENTLELVTEGDAWQPCLARRYGEPVGGLYFVRSGDITIWNARDTLGTQDRRAWGRGS